MRIFRGVSFFAASKEFRILLGPAAAYFAAKRPSTLTAEITYSDQGGRTYVESMTHDLEIYRDLPQAPTGTP